MNKETKSTWCCKEFLNANHPKQGSFEKYNKKFVMILDRDTPFSGHLVIKYCPFCGKKL